MQALGTIKASSEVHSSYNIMPMSTGIGFVSTKPIKINVH